MKKKCLPNINGQDTYATRLHTALQEKKHTEVCLSLSMFWSITLQWENYVNYWQTAHIGSANFTYCKPICKSSMHCSKLHPGLSWRFRLGNLTLTRASSHSVFISRINAASVSFSPRDSVGCNPSPAERILNLPIHSHSPEDTGAHFPWTWITLHAICTMYGRTVVPWSALIHLVQITLPYHEEWKR